MEIKTKFRTFDEIWYITRMCMLEHSKILEIRIRILDLNPPIITYMTETGHEVIEESAFASKEELKAYIQKEL